MKEFVFNVTPEEKKEQTLDKDVQKLIKNYNLELIRENTFSTLHGTKKIRLYEKQHQGIMYVELCSEKAPLIKIDEMNHTYGDGLIILTGFNETSNEYQKLEKSIVDLSEKYFFE